MSYIDGQLVLAVIFVALLALAAAAGLLPMPAAWVVVIRPTVARRQETTDP